MLSKLIVPPLSAGLAGEAADTVAVRVSESINVKGFVAGEGLALIVTVVPSCPIVVETTLEVEAVSFWSPL